MSPLKPCPFCGVDGDNRLFELWDSFDAGHIAHIHCTACGACGPSIYSEHGAGTAIMRSRWAWNGRTVDLGSAADGSQKPNGGEHGCPAKAGRHTDSAGRAYWVGKPGESLPLDPVEADEVVTAGKDRPKNTPKGPNRDATGFEGRGSQEPDATDCEARSKVMAPGGSDSPTGRGTNGAPAVSAGPAFTPRTAA